MIIEADLHTHTTASDGAKTPSEMVDLALDAGLKAVGITDHDTMAGTAEAAARGREIGIIVVPGIELSTTFGKSEIHILGYYLDPEADAIKTHMERCKFSRERRAKAIVKKLFDYGIPITYDMVEEKAGGGSVGRPHIAMVLMDLGIVGSVGSGFGKYLTEGTPGFVPKDIVTPEEGIDVILKSGGAAGIAHPGKIKSQEIIPSLIARGASFIEAFHPDHSRAARRFYARFAEKRHLIATGGSDAHYLNDSHTTTIAECGCAIDVVYELKARSVK
ncbi:MAG: PHP domain-containing protein [Abditibacteriota bacterium]|nr:PHP domain-containing protein [Abditibacteriota bacterium]